MNFTVSISKVFASFKDALAFVTEQAADGSIENVGIYPSTESQLPVFTSPVPAPAPASPESDAGNGKGRRSSKKTETLPDSASQNSQPASSPSASTESGSPSGTALAGTTPVASPSDAPADKGLTKEQLAAKHTEMRQLAPGKIKEKAENRAKCQAIILKYNPDGETEPAISKITADKIEAALAEVRAL